MRAKRVSAERQYELIMECRSSGMSDAQWCMQHGIKPGTFYNWVSKLRKKACYDIPELAGETVLLPAEKQDVVKLEIMSGHQPADDNASGYSICANAPAIEVALGAATIRINNHADPVLLKQVMQSIGGFLC